MNTSPRTLARFAMLAVVGLACSCAFADPEKKGDPLAGPNVTDKVAPGSHGSFGTGADKGDKKRGEPEIPHIAFMRAVQEAIGENAPADVRATPELMDKIKATAQEFQQAQRKFAQENRAEMQKGRRPGADREGAPDQEMMDKARELREKAPKAADTHTKIWAMLSEPQQKAVQAKLDLVQEEMRKKANERYIEQRAGKKAPQGKPGEQNAAPETDAKKPGKRPAAEAGEGGRNAVSPEQRERVMRLLERLTPEQREELIKRFEERLANGERSGPAGRPGRGNQGGGEAKPAPKGRDSAPKDEPTDKKPEGGN